MDGLAMNIKLVSILLTVIFLAGCGWAAKRQLVDAAAKIEIEREKRCTNKETFLSTTLCRESVIREYWPSDYAYWSSLNTALYEMNVLGAYADETGMSKEKFNDKYQLINSKFVASEQAEYQSLKAQNTAAWAAALSAIGSAAAQSESSFDDTYNNTQSLSTKLGFLTGQTISGFNKICTYSVVGSTMTTNISSTSICSQTHRF
jgi:hypothetical protein